MLFHNHGFPDARRLQSAGPSLGRAPPAGHTPPAGHRSSRPPPKRHPCGRRSLARHYGRRPAQKLAGGAAWLVPSEARQSSPRTQRRSPRRWRGPTTPRHRGRGRVGSGVPTPVPALCAATAVKTQPPRRPRRLVQLGLRGRPPHLEAPRGCRLGCVSNKHSPADTHPRRGGRHGCPHGGGHQLGWPPLPHPPPKGQPPCGERRTQDKGRTGHHADGHAAPPPLTKRTTNRMSREADGRHDASPHPPATPSPSHYHSPAVREPRR